MEVLPDVDAVQQGALLAKCFLFEGFRCCGQEDSRVVSEDTRQDLCKGEFTRFGMAKLDEKERLHTMTTVMGKRIQ